MINLKTHRRYLVSSFIILLFTLTPFRSAYSQAGSTCANPVVISSVPYSQTGQTTAGFGDDYSTNSCNTSYMGGDDFVYEYTPASNITISVSLSNTLGYTGLFIFDGCPSAGTCVAFQGSSAANPSLSGIALTGGTTYYIIISTWPSPQNTPFDISISEVYPYYDMLSGTQSTTSCGATFRDNGGTASYSNSFTGTTTFNPSGAGQKIILNFSSFNTESGWDKIWIYDGPNDTYPILVNGYSGTTIPTGNPFTSTATGGEITVKFISDGSVNKAGWEASVTCTGPVSCTDPSSLSATGINPSSVDLGWTENGSATAWDIELGTAGFSPTGVPTANDVTNNPYTYTGLTSSTSYDFYVRSECGGIQSSWIGPFNFTTAACNLQAPSGLTATNISSSSADLGWTENGNATVWDIEYGVSPYGFTGTPTVNNTSSNPYSLSGLSPSTTYQFKVRAECGGTSVWVGPYSFTTPAVPGSFAVKEASGWAKGVVQGTDGSLVYVGSRNSDAYVMKTDEAGSLIWAKQYGGASSDQAYDVVASSDGGYVIVGETVSTNLNISGTSGDYDIMVTKLDANGNHVWTRVIGRPTDDDGSFQSNTDIVANPDGTFSVTSTSYDLANRMTFIHLSSTGTVLAAKKLNTQSANGYAITKASTGWLVGGKMQVGGNPYFFVLKLSDSYTEDWSMRWGQNTSTNEAIYGVVENGANDYTVIGQTGEGGGLRMYAMRFTTSGAGSIIWEKTYSQAVTCSANDVVKDGSDIVITGSCSASGAGDYSDTYLMKINGATGAVIWQTEKPDNGSANRQGDGVCLLSDGSYGVAGLGSFDMLKFGPDGSICGGIPGSTVTNDLGTTLSNVDLTEGSVANIFAVANASKTPTFTNTGTITIDCQVLPIKLKSFNANCDNGSVKCEWSTYSELNNDYFTIEKSTDGYSFQEIGTIKGSGNSSNVNSYNFYDENPIAEVSYYRIKQTDYDGNFEYFPPVATNCTNNYKFDIFPSPFKDHITILLEEPNSQNIKIIIKDYLGRTINFKTEIIYNTIQLTFDNQISNGIYFLSLLNGNKLIHTEKIIKVNDN